MKRLFFLQTCGGMKSNSVLKTWDRSTWIEFIGCG